MSQLSLNRDVLLNRRHMLGGLAAGAGSLALAASSARVMAQASVCAATPTETRGPFPADGTNGAPRISVLSDSIVLRSEIRDSFAGSCTSIP